MNVKQQQEEEMLTPYEAYESNGALEHEASSSEQVQTLKDPRLVGWEFKIVRAKHDLFHDPDEFQNLCTEEAEAGWILLEKLDDRRVRFKRPIALREIIKPEFLSFDPYRCSYGSARLSIATLITAITVAIAVIVPAYLGYTLVAQALASPTRSLQSFPPLEQPSER